MMIPRRCSKCDKIIIGKDFSYTEYLGNEEWSIWCADCYLKSIDEVYTEMSRRAKEAKEKEEYK